MDGDAPNTSRTLWARYGKRGFDLLGTTALLIVLSPVLLLAALLVKLTSPGPILFVQERAGLNGAVFRLLKFRTMLGGRRPDAKELVPLSHPDITPVGRLLRRFKVDELPQLVNVLTGEMSLVGPRPTLPDQVAAYDEFRRQRILVRPGITGLNVLRAVSVAENSTFNPVAAPVGENNVTIHRPKVRSHRIRASDSGRMNPHIHVIVAHGPRQNKVKFFASYQVHDFCGGLA